jgi:hypothetical protein
LGAGEGSDKEADIIYPAWFVEDLTRNCCCARYSKPFGMLAFASAAARAAIHPDRNAVSSVGGLDLL